jgi:hypothetical protein
MTKEEATANITGPLPTVNPIAASQTIKRLTPFLVDVNTNQRNHHKLLSHHLVTACG